MNRLEKPKTNFTVIPNEIFSRSELSAEARFLWAYLASKPEGWDVKILDLQKHLKCGREKVYRMMKELIENELLTRVKRNTGETLYTLHEITLSRKPVLGALSQKPRSGFPARLVSTEREVITERALKANNRAREEQDFEDWWTVYPNKVGKKPAKAIWLRIKPDKAVLIADAEKRLREDNKWREGFICNPTTYLNQERWNDELKKGNGHETRGQRMERQQQELLRSIAEGGPLEPVVEGAGGHVRYEVDV